MSLVPSVEKPTGRAVPKQLSPFHSWLYRIIPGETDSGFVYFLMKDKRIVYIGQSRSIFHRLTSHEKLKDFDDVFFIPVPVASLTKIEVALISAFNPPLNRTGKGGVYALNEAVSMVYETMTGRDEEYEQQNYISSSNMASCELAASEVSEISDLAGNPYWVQQLISYLKISHLREIESAKRQIIQYMSDILDAKLLTNEDRPDEDWWEHLQSSLLDRCPKCGYVGTRNKHEHVK